MKIILEPYDPHWPEMFLSHKESIRISIGEGDIEHIGSTAVPGLAAKPVIDILVGVQDITALDATVEKMVAGGFTYMELYKHLMTNRRYFVRYEHLQGLTPPAILANDRSSPLAAGFTNVAHIHCWLLDSPDWVRHIAFRDYLRVHADIRHEYQAMKEKLALQEWDSSLAYSQAKNDFIKAVEADALVWYRST